MARVVGGVLSWLGVGLLAVLAWALFNAISRPNAVDTAAIALCSGLLVVGSFCCLVGFRLFLSRPNTYGSILSPIGWRVLGSLFAIGTVAAFVLFMTGPLAKLAPIPMLVGSVGWLALLACGCFYIARRLERQDGDAL